jgi:hypothetical protein
MATFNPVQPSTELFDSGFGNEEISFSSSRAPSPATQYSELLAETIRQDSSVGTNSETLKKIFRSFQSTIEAQSDQEHAANLEATVSKAHARTKQHYEDDLSALEEFADTEHARGMSDGRHACAQTHPTLLAQHNQTRQQQMVSCEVQAVPSMVSCAVQAGPSSDERSTECDIRLSNTSQGTQTGPGPKTESRAIQTSVETRSVETQTGPISSRTSNIAYKALGLLTASVGAISAATMCYHLNKA